ncbi:cobalamin B12-binding domain-containing protein [Methylobacterium trifolii]|uniref:B12-binding domain-containing protein n=1 Tax=Methylobacterium trifolii TaxID=1003092 RepID=A0ABQ4TYR0_9HYPH|nr:cobalamin B12-binding domain-containing protein [Methylobacterium trifolii]GJE60400.1 hypothetical protein MPOCJGCO_2512 [Methylobacterium trifolii]
MGDRTHFDGHHDIAAALQERCEVPAASGETLDDCRESLLAELATLGRQPAPDLPGALARIVEADILPRLMLAHQDLPPPTRLPVAHRPNPEQVERFSTLLLAPGEDDVRPHVLALLGEGLPLESLLLDLLAPAARHLGALWEEDECDFMDVTTALGRLQVITRMLCTRLEQDAASPGGRRILLLPCPGETHMFGISIVASFFRESGWTVTTVGGHPGLDLAALVGDEWFDVIGLSLSCEVFLPAMAESVFTLRRASLNQAVRLIVGGPLFVRNPEYARFTGADACAADGKAAPGIAERLLENRVEKRARAC